MQKESRVGFGCTLLRRANSQSDEHTSAASLCRSTRVRCSLPTPRQVYTSAGVLRTARPPSSRCNHTATRASMDAHEAGPFHVSNGPARDAPDVPREALTLSWQTSTPRPPPVRSSPGAVVPACGPRLRSGRPQGRHPHQQRQMEVQWWRCKGEWYPWCEAGMAVWWWSRAKREAPGEGRGRRKGDAWWWWHTRVTPCSGRVGPGAREWSM